MKPAQVLVLLVVLASGSASAPEVLGAWLAPRPGQQKTTLSYEGASYRRVTLDLFGGYAWNRFLFEGRRFSDRHDDQVDVGDGPCGGFRAGASF